MDQPTYQTVKYAAEASLIGTWVNFCAQPTAENLKISLELQRRLLSAEAHAVQTNYRFAMGLLPLLPFSFDSWAARQNS